jgi:hypothetical protein
MRRVEMAMDLPEAQRRAELAGIEKDARAVPFRAIGLLAPMWQRIAEKEVTHRAVRDGARIAIAIRRFALARGAPPPSLEALAPDFIEAVPQDPFGGAAYRHDPSTGRVWSVGEDGADDGGRNADPRSPWSGDGPDIAFPPAK